MGTVPENEQCYKEGCDTRVFRRGMCEDHYGEPQDETPDEETLTIQPYTISLEVDRCAACNELLTEGGPIGTWTTTNAQFPVHVACVKPRE